MTKLSDSVTNTHRNCKQLLILAHARPKTFIKMSNNPEN